LRHEAEAKSRTLQVRRARPGEAVRLPGVVIHRFPTCRRGAADRAAIASLFSSPNKSFNWPSKRLPGHIMEQGRLLVGSFVADLASILRLISLRVGNCFLEKENDHG
jgi:hypothetical protein